MAAVRHLEFVKFTLTVGAVKRPVLHQHTEFRKYRSNRCGDIAIFVIFMIAAAAILGFQKFQILTVCSPQEGSLRHRAKFHQNRSNGCRFNDFKNGGRPPSWICWAPIETPSDDHLVVSIALPNLVIIDAVVSII